MISMLITLDYFNGIQIHIFSYFITLLPLLLLLIYFSLIIFINYMTINIFINSRVYWVWYVGHLVLAFIYSNLIHF